MIRRIKKKNIIIAFTIVLLPFILYSCFNLTSVKVGAGGIKNRLEEIDNRWESSQEVKNIINNKVFIIGDSRMEYISNREKTIAIPSNFSFIALGGTKIDWFINDAMVILKDKLDNRKDNIKYHVVFNMGVNDLNDNKDVLIHSDNYFTLYEKLARMYEDVNFYILSVNPIDMSKINKMIYNQKRTSYKIETFNNNMVKNLEIINLKNMKYCDSYYNVDFTTIDGLHYDRTTDQNILDYLTQSCLYYK